MIDINDVKNSTHVFFQGAQGVNFGDDFFHASGAGRVRIRKVLKFLVGFPEKPDEAVTEAVRRLKAESPRTPLTIGQVSTMTSVLDRRDDENSAEPV